MEILFSFLLVLVGIVIIIWGADRLTDGSVGIAERLNIPQIVIGLTIVAMGTSAPELFVSLMAVYNGTVDLAVGNILGSNIFNALSIVGVTAVVCPIVISKNTIRKDMPIAVVSAGVLLLMCIDGVVHQWEAAILFAAFITFIVYTVRLAKKGKVEASVDEEKKNLSIGKAVFFIILGLVCLVFGGNLFVRGASAVAAFFGVSDAVIGLTVVACGTSLPELATSVVAARKGKSAIAIGNVIGSNVFNILMILGMTGLFMPLQLQNVTIVDLSVMMGSILLLWIFSFTKYTVARWEGLVLSGGYVAYIVWLISRV